MKRLTEKELTKYVRKETEQKIQQSERVTGNKANVIGMINDDTNEQQERESVNETSVKDLMVNDTDVQEEGEIVDDSVVDGTENATDKTIESEEVNDSEAEYIILDEISSSEDEEGMYDNRSDNQTVWGD